MAIDYCPTCKEMKMWDTHRCPPRFECIMRDAVEEILGCDEKNEITQMTEDEFEELEWKAVYAGDLDEAAEKFCKRYVDRAADYGDYYGEREFDVYVRDLSGSIKRTVVQSEIEMKYRASYRGARDVALPTWAGEEVEAA